MSRNFIGLMIFITMILVSVNLWYDFSKTKTLSAKVEKHEAALVQHERDLQLAGETLRQMALLLAEQELRCKCR